MPLYEGRCEYCGETDEYVSKIANLGDLIGECPCGGSVVRTSAIHSATIIGFTPTNFVEHNGQVIDSPQKEKAAMDAAGGKLQFIRKGSAEEKNMLKSAESLSERRAAQHGFSSARARRDYTRTESIKRGDPL